MKYNDPNEYWWHEGDSIEEEERLKVAIVQGLTFVTMLIVLLALCALLGSCTTTKVVTVDRVHNDTTYITKLQYDSIHVHDSIMVSEKGDTVRIEKWHTKFIESIRHDTVYQSRTDSVPTPYPVIHEVEKNLTTLQQGLMATGGISIMAVVILIGWRLKRLLP